MNDPFAEYRTPQPSFDAVTDTDGRSLTLTATDVAQFHALAHAVVALANQHGWRVTKMHRHGPNIEVLTVTPPR